MQKSEGRAVICQKFGGTSILVQVPKVTSKPISSIQSGIRKTSSPSTKGLIEIQKAVREIADSFSAEFEHLAKRYPPKEVELSFGLVFSEDLKLWGIGVGGEQSLSVKITWSPAVSQ